MKIPLFWTLLFAITMIGCRGTEDAPTPAQSPRPVKAVLLKARANPATKTVTGSVGSWKTEKIAFEVNGRIKRVIEPNEDIEGKIPSLSSDDKGPLGNLITIDIQQFLNITPTPIAEIETERYQLQLKSAEAQLEQSKKAHAAAEIELKQSIPQQVIAAQADQALAVTEFERAERLVKKNAGAQADVDRAKAKRETAKAQIKQLEAVGLAKAAELESLFFKIEQSKQAVNDAKRNLNDCVLYSSFRGQITEVHVVPGSVVGPGEPVATIQMMNPIKIEFEVSAEESRTLRGRHRLEVHFDREGQHEIKDGFLYLIDPVADPQTRTFTVTLLSLNQKTNSVFDDSSNTKLAATDQVWRLDFDFLPGQRQGLNFVSTEAICEDDKGHFLWKVDNATIKSAMPKDRKLKVSKVRIEKGLVQIPFLGNFVFQQIEIKDPSFDPTTHLVAGKLRTKDGSGKNWDGDTVILDRGQQWKLRPGDLVTVVLSEESDSLADDKNFFVPMDAISHTPEGNFVFLVQSSGGQSTAKMVKVEIDDKGEAQNSSSLRRIRPVDRSINLENQQLITRGVHYLRDGEPVRVLESGGGR